MLIYLLLEIVQPSVQQRADWKLVGFKKRPCEFSIYIQICYNAYKRIDNKPIY